MGPRLTNYRRAFAEGPCALEYPLAAERTYCCAPAEVAECDVLVIGSAIGLSTVPYLLKQAADLRRKIKVAVVDAGPF